MGKKETCKNDIKAFVENVVMLYKTLDNSLLIDGKAVNLSRRKICEVSLKNNPDFYFKFYEAINNYRTKLKELLSSRSSSFVSLESDDSAIAVFGGVSAGARIKNINSIFSKVYQYKMKKEKGEVPFNKCINDIFGLRVKVPFLKIKTVYDLLVKLKTENAWGYRITDASKKKEKYRGVHMYISNGNFSLPWEIQFWLKRHDSRNRKSHSKYKLSYTSWEAMYGKEGLYEVIKNGTI